MQRERKGLCLSSKSPTPILKTQQCSGSKFLPQTQLCFSQGPKASKRFHFSRHTKNEKRLLKLHLIRRGVEAHSDQYAVATKQGAALFVVVCVSLWCLSLAHNPKGGAFSLALEKFCGSELCRENSMTEGISNIIFGGMMELWNKFRSVNLQVQCKLTETNQPNSLQPTLLYGQI